MGVVYVSHIPCRHMPANLLAERKAVKQLAYHVLHIIQSNMRLPYTSLVAAIILQHVCGDDELTIGIEFMFVKPPTIGYHLYKDVA